MLDPSNGEHWNFPHKQGGMNKLGKPKYLTHLTDKYILQTYFRYEPLW